MVTIHNANIIDWKLSDDCLEFTASHVYFDGELHENATLVFKLLRPVTAMSYDYKLNAWVCETKVERLKNISALHFKLDIHYSLKGLGAESGKLIALSILSRDPSVIWAEK